MTEHLETIEAVIEKLDGPKAVAELTNRTGSPSVVWNWIDRQRFPSNTFTIIKPALEQRGFTAPNHLWGMP